MVVGCRSRACQSIPYSVLRSGECWRHNMTLSKSRARLCASHVVPRDLADVERADLPHDRGELVVHDLKHTIDASLTECRKAPHVRPPNADRRGAQCDRLQHVSAATYTAVDEHRDAAAHRIHDLDQHA